MLAIALNGAASSDSCEDASDKAVQDFKVRAEKLFLAYTENRIKNYKTMQPQRCSEHTIYVIIDGKGRYANVGASWTVVLYEDDHHVSIYPGE
jgi:hypothetical protein